MIMNIPKSTLAPFGYTGIPDMNVSIPFVLEFIHDNMGDAFEVVCELYRFRAADKATQKGIRQDMEEALDFLGGDPLSTVLVQKINSKSGNIAGFAMIYSFTLPGSSDAHSGRVNYDY